MTTNQQSDGGALARRTGALGPDSATAASDAESEADTYDAYPRWPIVLLAAGAFVAIWGGWVDLGRLAGFGPVNLLPGIVDFYVDLSITLPLGMEVYAAFALGVWLTHRRIRPAARTFAGWSVLASLIIGAVGQVAYHLLAAAQVDHAPTPIVVAVACVPVAVMGMGAALSHLLAPVHGRHRTSRTALGHLTAVAVEREDDRLSTPAGKDLAHAGTGGPTTAAIDSRTGSRPASHTRITPSRATALDRRRPAVQVAPVAQGQDGPEPTDRDKEILRLVPQVTSERELAALVPWSRSTVNRVLRAHGIVLRQQSGTDEGLDLAPTSAVQTERWATTPLARDVDQNHDHADGEATGDQPEPASTAEPTSEPASTQNQDPVMTDAELTTAPTGASDSTKVAAHA